MRYFWLLDQEAQRMFEFIYQPGQENLGDYPTKLHSGEHHQHVRPYYVHMPNSPAFLPRALKPASRRGCVSILGDAYRKRSPLPSITTESRYGTAEPIQHYIPCKPDTAAWFLRSPNTVALHSISTATANLQSYTLYIHDEILNREKILEVLECPKMGHSVNNCCNDPKKFTDAFYTLL